MIQLQLIDKVMCHEGSLQFDKYGTVRTTQRPKCSYKQSKLKVSRQK